MVKRDLVQKPTGNFLQWKRIDHRSSWKRSDWPRNWSNPLRFDLHETLRFYQQQQNLHFIDASVQFDKKEKEEVQDEKNYDDFITNFVS